MCNTKKKAFGYLGIVSLSMILILLFSCSTSPLYDMVYADYYGNASSVPLLIGKGWIHGKIPYKDLFADSGPLFYLIQAIGWKFGGRYGVFVIQIINFTIIFSFTYKLLCFFVSRKISLMLLLLMLFPIMATLSGGNSPEEFCLTLSVLAFYISLIALNNKKILSKDFFILGMITGSVCMIHFTGGGVVYGIVLFAFIYVYQNGRSNMVKNLCYYMAGVTLTVVPFIIYFVANQAFSQMIQGVFVHNLKILWIDSTGINLFIHKFIKCIPLLFLLILGIYSIMFFSKEKGMLFVMVSIGLLPFLLMGTGNWHLYLPSVFCIPLMEAFYLSMKNRKKVKHMVLLYTCCILGIYTLPVIHYYSYVTDEQRMVYRDFINDFLVYQEKTGKSGLFLINVPASVYLETDVIPEYAYFAEQTLYNKTNNQVQKELNNYILEDCHESILVTQSSGAIYTEYGNYVMCDSYYYGRKIITVYECLEEKE